MEIFHNAVDVSLNNCKFLPNNAIEHVDYQPLQAMIFNRPVILTLAHLKQSWITNKALFVMEKELYNFDFKLLEKIHIQSACFLLGLNLHCLSPETKNCHCHALPIEAGNNVMVKPPLSGCIPLRQHNPGYALGYWTEHGWIGELRYWQIQVILNQLGVVAVVDGVGIRKE